MCIFVVEDDRLIRTILVEELEDRGYTVAAAQSGDEAMAMLPGLPHRPRVLITDVHMPGGLGGVELARGVRALLPGTPVIYTTGRPDSLPSLGESQVLVRKPYTPGEIVAQLRRMVGD